MKDNDRLIWLQVSTFAGIVPWAQHYHGTMSGEKDGKLVEEPVTQRLNLVQARKKNREDCSNPALDIDPKDVDSKHLWKPGDKVQFFWSERSVIIAARKQWRGVFPEAKLLALGLYGSCGPLKVVDATEKGLKKRINLLYYQAEKAGFWEGNQPLMETLLKQWDQIIEDLD